VIPSPARRGGSRLWAVPSGLHLSTEKGIFIKNGSGPIPLPFAKARATLAPDLVADKICIKNCFDSDMAASVREGFRILKVTIGEGVRVSVVKDDTVMPLELESVPRSNDGAVEVTTTTEWGIVLMSFRSWEDRGGSVSGVVFGTSFSTSFGVGEEEYWRLR
jgi:hypothetical protein